jgi:hypothetical protein
LQHVDDHDHLDDGLDLSALHDVHHLHAELWWVWYLRRDLCERARLRGGCRRRL